MRQEIVPEIVGECFIEAIQDDKEVQFEGPDGAFDGIAPMHIRGHQLVICFPLLLDGALIILDELIVQELEVKYVAAFV